ncbi:IgGFc-binding protein-like [Narcine bancroftii]|uniref:IgGFc-binding protein-like n=1 Tax=Narcine bancroftii TaxID=1343680 RepID=UPI003831805D
MSAGAPRGAAQSRGLRCLMATWTLFFLAVATFLGASHAGHGGREFVLAFMQNYRSSRNTKLELLITAYQGSTKVNVMQQKLQKSLFVKKGDTISFSVMELEEIFNAGRSDQTVLVRSDKDISVSTFSNKPYTVDASVIYPVQSLGTEYIVFTPPTGLASQLKEFAVSNTGQENAVKVTLKQRMFFEQHWYNAGQDIKLVLKPYETVQFQNKQDLTGTQVRAQHPVALTAGHTCSAVSGNCNHVYEQLRPVNSWGTEFAVAPSKTQKGNDWVYVLASQATVLNAEGREWEMSPLQVLKFNVNQDHPLYITASKGVQVLYYSTGRTKGYDPYFMTVVPSQDFAESYWVRGLKNFENHISIVAKTAEVSQILLEGKKMTKNIKWHPIPRSPYSWTDVKTGRKQESHLLASKSGERFGVYKYGVEKRNGYGTQGSAVGRGENSGDPCSVVRCRSETQCSVVDGAAVCVPTSSAICWAWGDPHYHTFDGLNFDFQGTCTYTIAKSCSNDPSLPVFTISAKNDNRGNRKVSYVRTIKVNVYGFNISVRKWEYGLVRVNGIKTHLPVSLNDGQVTLYESGVSVTIETDFYLRVSYDWNHHLVVEVSSLHSGNVCGLCGNYNGDRSDDFRTPKGTVASGPSDFGKSWKVPDRDTKCRDDCEGGCALCRAQLRKRYEGPQSCGLITLKQGPFRDLPC